MKILKITGLCLFLLAFLLFNLSMFMDRYQITDNTLLKSGITQTQLQSIKAFDPSLETETLTKLQLIDRLGKAMEHCNQLSTKEGNDDLMIWSTQDVLSGIAVSSARGLIVDQLWLFRFLIFGLGLIGGLLFSLTNIPIHIADLKNLYINLFRFNGWVSVFLFLYFLGFYYVFYYYPAILAEPILLTDPLSRWLSGNPSSNWFVYGVLYTFIVLVMGVKFILKYRNNRYHFIRTLSVMFFQTIFAFLIPQLLIRFHQPSVDLKSMWPLDYYFFYGSHLEELSHAGFFGHFALVWGILLFVVVVPIVTYLVGKRWYCSWVCGCGGLAETGGDPFRHLSSKKILAWRIERITIHSVLIFVLIMTGFTLYSYFSGRETLFGSPTDSMQSVYGFVIGIVMAGFVGTGLYPLLGSRVWCRFACPLAAYLGIVQRFKSRFRITTNGGQCISCGNCSTYCEMGIDVRAQAQRGENIIRASCVGCGICAEVCPRGVLKLENGPVATRFKKQAR